MEVLPILSLLLALCISALWPLIWILFSIVYYKPELFPSSGRWSSNSPKQRRDAWETLIIAIQAEAQGTICGFSTCKQNKGNERQLSPYLWDLTLSPGRITTELNCEIPRWYLLETFLVWWYLLTSANNHVFKWELRVGKPFCFSHTRTDIYQSNVWSKTTYPFVPDSEALSIPHYIRQELS